MQQPIKFDATFRWGETYSYSLSPFDNLESLVPNAAGLYSWHIRLRPGADRELMRLAHSAYHQRTLSAAVTGTLRMKYTGILEREGDVADDIPFALADQILFMMSYPLYVGISLDLKSRLSTHKSQLLTSLKCEPSSFVDDTAFQSDSQEESSFFAQRLAALFLKSQCSRTDCLFVRYILHPAAAEPSSSATRPQIRTELLQAERFANNLFNPVFGRR